MTAQKNFYFQTGRRRRHYRRGNLARGGADVGFKTNEYATLLGGRWFEFDEENPMIGFRGASRYTTAYQGFALECAAMKLMRDDMGLTM